MTSASNQPGRYRAPALAVALVLLVLAVFWHVPRGEFLNWDDDINITTNPHLHGLSADNLRWMFTDVSYMRRYVPLTWLNWAVEYELFGLTPKSAHVGNLLFHVANAVLLFVLIRAILRRLTPEGGRGSRIDVAAALGAALWAIHPLRVEPVAWASGRIYCVATFLLLISAVAYLRAHATPPRRNRAWWATAFVAYTLSLLTYPISAGYIVVLAVLDWLVLRRLGGAAGWRKAGVWVEKAAFATPAIAIAAATVWARLHVTGLWQAMRPPTLAEFGLASRAAQAGYVVARYLYKSLIPSHLAPVYTTLVNFRPLDAPFVASSALVVVITALVIWRWRRNPGLAAVWICYLALVAPMLGFTEHPHYANDRYSQLSTMPFFVGIAFGLVALTRTKATWRIGVATALVTGGALAIASTRQVAIWHDGKTLLTYLIDETPEDAPRARLLTRLGQWYVRQGDLADAQAQLERAVQLGPDQWQAHLALAEVVGTRGDQTRALEELARAFELNPGIPAISRELGFALLSSGRFADAIAVLRRQVTLYPDDAVSCSNLAAALLQTGNPAEAETAARRAVALQPQMSDAHSNLATALRLLGRTPDAIAEYNAAIRCQPDNVSAETGLADTYRNSGDVAAAIPHYLRALQLSPNSAEAHEGLGVALEMSGRWAEAVPQFEAAIALRPNGTALHYNLAVALWQSGQVEQARREFTKVLQLDPANAEARKALDQLPR